MSKKIVLMLLIGIVSMALHAQITTSGMNGLVTGGGEPMIGATVQAVHLPSGTTYGAITNVDG